jgi:hypothetical protein
MSKPPDQVPATAGRSHLRASHADREQVIGTLKAAFVQGRLAKDEFDLRVGQALASRTYGDLAALTADLPAGLAAAEPSKLARAPGERSILRRPGLLMTAETVLYVGMWPLAFALPTNSEGDPVDGVSLLGPATVFYLLLLTCTCVWGQVLRSRQENLSGGQPPGRPAPRADGGQGPRGRLRGGRVPQADPYHLHTAEATRRQLPRPALPARDHRARGALAAGTASAQPC